MSKHIVKRAKPHKRNIRLISYNEMASKKEGSLENGVQNHVLKVWQGGGEMVTSQQAAPFLTIVMAGLSQVCDAQWAC